jgi:hypothetical protein
LDAVRLSAPVPGLRVAIAAGAVVAVRPNAAATAWGRLQGLADADWFALAAQAARPKAHSARPLSPSPGKRCAWCRWRWPTDCCSG